MLTSNGITDYSILYAIASLTSITVDGVSITPTPMPTATSAPTMTPMPKPTKPYNEEWTDVTWETCTLRTWLNEDFYTTAFSKKERGYIAETLVKNEDNPEYGTVGGNDTRDKVFLLSIGEATTYFDPDPDAYGPARRAKVTEYAKAQGGWAYSEAEKTRNLRRHKAAKK